MLAKGDLSARLDAFEKLNPKEQQLVRDYAKMTLAIPNNGVGDFTTIARYAKNVGGIDDPAVVEKLRFVLLGKDGKAKEAVFQGKDILHYEAEERKKVRIEGEEAQKKRDLADAEERKHHAESLGGGVGPDGKPISRKGHRQTEAAQMIDEYGKWGVAIAGALLGFTFGGPVGAFIGLILGLALGAFIAPKLAGFVDQQFAPEPTPATPPKPVVPAVVQTPPLVIEGKGSPVIDLKGGPQSDKKNLLLTGSGAQGIVEYHVENAGDGKAHMIIDKLSIRAGDKVNEVMDAKGMVIEVGADGTVDLSKTKLMMPALQTANDTIKENREGLNSKPELNLTDLEKGAKLNAEAEQQVTFTYKHAEGSRVATVTLTGKLVDDGKGGKDFVVSQFDQALPVVTDVSGKQIGTPSSLVGTNADGKIEPLVIHGLKAPKDGQSLQEYIEQNKGALKALDPMLQQRTPPEPQAPSTPKVTTPAPSRGPSG